MNNNWNGVGLPPVGAKCEYFRHEQSRHSETLKTGAQVEIIAHYSPYNDGDYVAVFSYESDPKDGFRDVAQGIASCFAPAKSEREKEIEKMLSYCAYRKHDQEFIKELGLLYDAGYRLK